MRSVEHGREPPDSSSGSVPWKGNSICPRKLAALSFLLMEVAAAGTVRETNLWRRLCGIAAMPRSCLIF